MTYKLIISHIKDITEVIKGIKVGERIVTGANSLIDSESNLKDALAWMAGMSGMEHGPQRK